MSDFKTVVFCAALAALYWAIFVMPHHIAAVVVSVQ